MNKHGKPLAAFLRSDALDWLEWMLSEGTDPNELLAAACYSEREELVDVLLSRGAAPNSGIRAAVDGPKPKMLEKLLQTGADPNLGASSGQALILAPSHITYAEIVATLLKAGANPSVVDSFGRTPLHLASSPVAIESAATIRLLIMHGADISARDSSGSLPIHRAAETGSVGIVEVLLELGAEPNAKDLAGLTARERAQIRSERWRGEQPEVGPDANWKGVCELLSR